MGSGEMKARRARGSLDLRVVVGRTRGRRCEKGGIESRRE